MLKDLQDGYTSDVLFISRLERGENPWDGLREVSGR